MSEGFSEAFETDWQLENESINSAINKCFIVLSEYVYLKTFVRSQNNHGVISFSS